MKIKKELSNSMDHFDYESQLLQVQDNQQQGNKNLS